MILKTDRLELISGNAELINSEINDRKIFSKLLNAVVPENWPPPLNDEDSMNWFKTKIEEDSLNEGFLLWYIILEEKNIREAIGGIGFKGKPDKNGIVEMGYSIMENHQKRGYATEAAKTLIDFAFKRSEITSIIAETFPKLIPSQNVLKKCGFNFIGNGSEDGAIRFELKKENYIKPATSL